MRQIQALRQEIDDEEEEYGDEESHGTRSSHKNIGSLDASYANKFYLSVKDNDTDLRFPQHTKKSVQSKLVVPKKQTEELSQAVVLQKKALIPVREVEDNHEEAWREADAEVAKRTKELKIE